MQDKCILESQSINPHYLPVITRMIKDKKALEQVENVFGHMENGGKWLKRKHKLF